MELLGGAHLGELHGHLQLVVLHDRLAELELVDGADLVRIEELLHHQPLAERPQHHEVLLAARGVLRQRPAPRLLQRLRQQRVGAVAAFVGAEVVGLREIDRIDLRLREELGDVDALRRPLLERLQLLLGEEDVLAARELVALHDLVAGDAPLVLRTEELLLNPAAALPVQHVEADLFARFGGRKELHRNRDETERNLGGRNRTWHS